MKGKYITVLYFEVGRVFQYNNVEHFKYGWNGNDNDDTENIEFYLGMIHRHSLTGCIWMFHDNDTVLRNYKLNTITHG